MARTSALPDKNSNTVSLRISLLGQFRVEVNGETVPPERWARRSAKLLIKLLALQPTHQLHRERVMDLLWPDQEFDSAVNSLHKTLHAARRALQPDLRAGEESSFLVTHEHHVVLRATGELWIDVEAFERQAMDALKAETPELYRDVLDLYGGELLPEDVYEEWTRARREELRSLHRRIAQRLLKLYESAEDIERGISLCQKLLTCDRTDESAWRSLIMFTAQSGDRSAALRYFDQCRKALNEELDARPGPETIALRDQIAAGKIGPQHTDEEKQTTKPVHGGVNERVEPRKSNLPHVVTSFIGRESEKAALKELLDQRRLITLTGAGGIGKTRLAVEVAAALREEFEYGVWLVELASLNDRALVQKALANVLNVREEAGCDLIETLCAHLQTKRVLILLDNCEHLVATCAELAITLLHSCSNVHVLATSREALNVPGEVVWRVATLSLPENDAVGDVESSIECEAVRLFVDRAKLNAPAWSLTKQNAGAVGQICRRLDGIPLAIELAAARVKALSPEQILNKLNDRFLLLTSGSRAVVPRHQTLSAAIRWSYELLSDEERKLLRRLSVFAGGWSLDAAESVGSGDDVQEQDVLTLISYLVDKSLVIVETQDPEARYRMLETIRQYAIERLRETDEETSLRESHYAYFLELARRAAEEYSTEKQRLWFARLDAELDNLRAALDWSIYEVKDAEKALRLGNALRRFWESQCHFQEGRYWYEAALEIDDAPRLAPLRADALRCIGNLAVWQGDLVGARSSFESALELARATNDRPLAAILLYQLGFILTNIGDFELAPRYLEESARIYGELNDQHGLALVSNGLGALAYNQCDYDKAAENFGRALSIHRSRQYVSGVMGMLQNLGATAHMQGKLDLAEKYLLELLQLSEESGELRWNSHARHVLGYVSNDRGDYAQALSYFRRALNPESEAGGKINVAQALEGLACTAAAQGDARRAVKLLGAVDALREELKIIRTTAEQNYLDNYMNKARQSLDDAEIICALEEGRSMSFEQTIKYALQLN